MKIKKKLLFIVNVDWFFTSHRLPIAVSAFKNGYEVHVACAITDRKEYLESMGLIVHPLNLSRGSTGIMQEFKSFRDIFKVLKVVKPDIVHFVTIKPVLYGGIASRLLMIKNKVFAISGMGYVFTSKSARTSLLRNFIIALYKLALGSKTSKVIVQNTDDRDILTRFNVIKESQEILIRGSGVNLETHIYEREPDSVPVVVMASRLLKDKGVMEFIEAAKILLKKGVSAKFKLYGDIDIHNPASLTQNNVDEVKKEGIIEVHGYTNDIAEVFSASHIVVLPSYREGLPKVLIEAAACGRAVVTTNVPGCRDAIEENKTGLLVKAKDSDSLAEAIEKLVDDKDLREKMGLAGRRLAEEEFSIKKVIDIHLNIYQSFY